MKGTGGSLAGATAERVSARVEFIATSVVALAIKWFADIYQIIMDASRGFAVYYALQCSLAALVASRPDPHLNLVRGLLFAIGTGLLILVLIFGLAADGG